jgi:excisionase family DNA binding protein
MEKLMTVDQVSALYNVSKKHVYRLIWEEKLKALKLGRLLRITQPDAEAYLKQRLHAGWGGAVAGRSLT